MRSRPGRFVDLRLKQRVKQVPAVGRQRRPSSPRGREPVGAGGAAGMAFPPSR